MAAERASEKLLYRLFFEGYDFPNGTKYRKQNDNENQNVDYGNKQIFTPVDKVKFPIPEPAGQKENQKNEKNHGYAAFGRTGKVRRTQGDMRGDSDGKVEPEIRLPAAPECKWKEIWQEIFSTGQKMFICWQHAFRQQFAWNQPQECDAKPDRTGSDEEVSGFLKETVGIVCVIDISERSVVARREKFHLNDLMSENDTE